LHCLPVLVVAVYFGALVTAQLELCEFASFTILQLHFHHCNPNSTVFDSQQLGLFVDAADHMGRLFSVDGLSNPEIQVA